MNATERIVLIELTKSLSDSQTKKFSTDWYDYANKMRNVINTVVPVLNKLVSEENKDNN